jgi:hypothetical protein
MRNNEIEQFLSEFNKTNVAECEQYAITRDSPTNEAWGGLKGTNCMKAKGNCWDWVHSDQMFVKAGRQSGWTL